jgi:glucuronoarabinoxylan endo-1,4-beta-xylanase
MACIVASLIPLAVTTASAQTATINYGAAQQTIRGFGGATAWLGQLTVPQANALFSPTSGLGLNVLRVRIDPKGSATSTPPWATTTPNTGSWLDEVTNAREAVAANPNAIVMATPWTPPLSMKSSSSSQPFFNGTCSPATGYCGGFLQPANYAAYAQYLEDFVTYFNNNAGFDLYAISMQNEPDFANVNFESCNWTAAQMDTWIAGNASTLTTKLIMPESFQFIQAQSNTALEDPAAEPLISIIGGHLYGSSPSVYTLAQQNKKELWMTEHMFTPAGAQPAIGDALQLAEEIHNSMVVGNYSAYVYWWIWDDPADGINYGLINSSTTAPAPTYYGDAIGQFSKFVQPGYVLVNATANPVSGVDVSAYTGSGNDVIVAINSNSSASSVTFNLTGSTASSFTPHQTSASAQLAQLSAVSVSGDAFTYSLPAQSITTFVGSSTSTGGTPGFTLSPSASTLSVTQGSSVTDTISVTDVNGFSGSATFTATGLPSGVTASFSPTSSATSSVLTLTASSTATTGPFTVTITGASGSTTASTTLTLNVSPAATSGSSCTVDYTISPQNSSQFGGAITIKNGGSTTLSNWTLTWSFANGQTIAQSWNGAESQSGANVTVTQQAGQTWENIPAGGSYAGFGFNGTWNGATNAIPSAFSLNGTPCTVN